MHQLANAGVGLQLALHCRPACVSCVTTLLLGCCAESAEGRAAFMDDRAFNPHLMKTMPKPAAQPKQRAPADDFSVRAGRENEQVYRTPAPGTSGTYFRTPSTPWLPSLVHIVLHATQQYSNWIHHLLCCVSRARICCHLQAAGRATTASGRARPSPLSTQTL